MDVSKRTLLSLLHTLNYAIAFNEVNSQLNDIQSQHFEDAGLNVLDVRDPFTVYSQGKEDRLWLSLLCNVKSEREAVEQLNKQGVEDEVISVPDETRLLQAMRDSITRYNERHLFFMLESEYDDDLRSMLGETGALAFKADINALLNRHLVCGNADRSIKLIKQFLSEKGAPYTKPEHPYMAKHDARFAEMYARIRESIAKMTAEESATS